MSKQIIKTLLFSAIFFLLPSLANAAPLPVLNFSDITAGPKTGNTDGVGSGAIVTIWGNNLGSTQGTSKVYVGSVEATAIYYWKDADGTLPGGPADLKTYHKMQEIAFAVPIGAPDGVTTIKVVVNGVDSNMLPFTVRSGNIRFIKSTGNDTTGDGSWDLPWATIENTVTGGNSKLNAGDLVYSVGVGATNGISVGATSPIAGTAVDHISMLAYPNTRVNITGNAGNPFSIFYNGDNPYWNWSKVSVTTAVSGFNVTRDNRIVGVEITGPSVYDGHAGAIGGNCAGVAGCTSPEGGEYLGVYIHNYGTDNGVQTAGHVGTSSADYPAGLGTTWDTTQHLYYVSNRSGSPIKAYEIGWNYLVNNPIYQGIDIYDRVQCGDWTGIMKVHNNVIKNQRGVAINVDFSNCSPSPVVPFEIHDNLIVQNLVSAVSYAGSALQINTPVVGGTLPISNRIYNNTIYGYAASNSFMAGNTDFKNNIIVDNSYLNYFDLAPTSNSNNSFFSSLGVAIPAWAGIGSIDGNPLFKDASGGDFSLLSNSPVKMNGADDTIIAAPTDLYGQLRIAGSVSMGAVQFLNDLVAPAAPSGLSVQ